MGLIVAQLLTGLANAATLFLVASGLSLIFGVTRIVNFAHGSLYMLGAFIGYSLMQVLPGAIGFWSSVLLAGLAVGVIGVIIEICVLRPIYRAPELFQLVATFGVILVIQDLALLVWGAEDVLGPRAPRLEGVVRILDEPVPKYDLALIALTPFVLFGLWYLLARTRLGMLVRAATQDREMVGALGVNQAWLFTGVFFLGAALAGIGGAIQLPKGGADLLMDFNILAAIFVVVVIGGMGSLPGAYVAAVLISVLNVFGVTYLPQSTLVLMFVVMAVVLSVRPYGLFGREEVAGEHGQVGEPERPIEPAGTRGRIAVALLLLALALLPLADAPFLVILATDVIIFCLFAASLHFLLGLGGLVSFGHAAYFGGGAYAAALLVRHADAPMELAFALAPLGAGMTAVIVGWLCLRLTGVYFAMLTLALAQLLWSLVFQWDEFTGGDDGLVGIWPAAWLAGNTAYFYFTLVTGVGGILFLRHVAHSPFGYALRAARDSTRQAEATGIHTRRVQWAAFAFAGAMAGVAGALFVFSKGSVFPTELELARSFDGLIVVFLGGVKTLSGGVVGAASLELVEDYLTRFEYWRLTLGLLIIAVVILAPYGIVGTLWRVAERLGWQRAPAPALAGGALATPGLPGARDGREDVGGAGGPGGLGGLGGSGVPHGPVGASGSASSSADDREGRAPLAAERTGIVLEVRALSKRFGGIRAVEEVSFTVREGELLALIGPNGAGKTTCFNMLMGQLKPSAGRVLLQGEDITGLPPRRIWRKGVGRTFQITATYPSMTVLENIQMALISHHRRLFSVLPRAHAMYRDEAMTLLGLVGMSAQANRACAILAYGDLKRLELAIALSHEPTLLLMDEPTAGMAPQARTALMQLTADIVRERRISVLFTEHDMDVVFAHAHRVMVLNRGELIAEGSVEAIRGDAMVQQVYLGGGTLFAGEGP